MSCCFTSNVRFMPCLSSVIRGLFISLTSVSSSSFSPQMLTVSGQYACVARNIRRSGFPKRNAQLPPLSKTSNSPSIVTFPSCILPFHTANDGTIIPFPILSCLSDFFHFPSRCLTFSNTVTHIAATIAHPSNNADTLTISPCGPSKRSVFWNGTSIPVLHIDLVTFSCPTEYRSTMVSFGAMLGTGTAGLHISTTSILADSWAVGISPTLLTALPHFPVAPLMLYSTTQTRHLLNGHIIHLSCAARGLTQDRLTNRPEGRFQRRNSLSARAVNTSMARSSAVVAFSRCWRGSPWLERKARYFRHGIISIDSSPGSELFEVHTVTLWRVWLDWIEC